MGKKDTSTTYLFDLVHILSAIGVPKFRVQEAVMGFIRILNIIGVDTSELEVKVEVCHDVPIAAEKIEVKFVL